MACYGGYATDFDDVYNFCLDFSFNAADFDIVIIDCCMLVSEAQRIRRQLSSVWHLFLDLYRLMLWILKIACSDSDT